MKIGALLTSAGINIALCVVLLSLFSVLRKQPGNTSVYFGRMLVQNHKRKQRSFRFERLVPSPSWIIKAWGYTEGDILAIAGLDAVVFLRMLVFSIRIFSVAAVICLFAVLPLNYLGKDRPRHYIASENLDAFTIANVVEGSKWLWVHCLALYIISFSACILLYLEYRNISRMRLAHIAKSPPSPHHFTILVRAIPKSKDQSFDDTVNDFFTSYYASTYLSHQIIYRAGKVQKLMNDAEDVCKRIVRAKDAMDKKCLSSQIRCGLCIGISDSVQLYRVNFELDEVHPSINANYTATKVKECASAFVFFKTRYAALVATQILQTSNPMSWVIDLAPKPNDVYWSNLWIPYRQLWFRRIATLLATIAFMIVFLIPVTFVQGLTQLEQLQQRLPFLRGLLKEKFMSQLITGYLPSVILILFLYTVPPIMKFFSSVEGPISYSARKKSACSKVLYFTIWNVFFVNVLSGSIISQLDAISSPKAIPIQLAKAVPTQATFFITYVLTSGWASLCSEAVLLFPLIVNFVRRKICKKEMDPKSVPSFPYDTEVPRVLLFGLVGFTCSTLAPLILPFLLVYFCLGYIVYRNQILNVYCSKYETGGQLWPIMHNTTIFSLVLSQIIALGVFGIKRSPVASGFTIPLIILTLIFNEYCRQRFYPTFKTMPSQDIIDMDHEDEKNDRMEIILQQLHKAYCQFPPELTEEEETADDGGLNSVEVGECSGEKELAQSPNHRVESLLQPSPNHKVESLHQPSSIGSPQSHGRV